MPLAPAVAPFSSEKWLARLNVAAVGTALAGCTAAAMGSSSLASGWAVGIPTLYLGAVWAAVLRHKATIGNSRIRWGWIASIPLAAVNGGLCCAGLFATEQGISVDPGAIVMGLVLGATLGIFIWGPALLLTIAFFGAPIAWAQRLAAKGLAGTERGERLIGIACALMGLTALAVSWNAHPSTDPEMHFGSQDSPSGHVFGQVLAALGVVLGSITATLATLRERRRAAFVARVEAGAVPRYRVDESPEGKVLVRVESHGAGAYRVADFDEEVCLLDDAGQAVEPRHAMR